LEHILREVFNRVVQTFRARAPISELPSIMADESAIGPDFVCIGAQKGGTRWLFDQLSYHPDFWMPPIKELHYLDARVRVERAEPLYARGLANVDWVNRSREGSNSRPLEQVDLGWLEALIWLNRQPYDLELYARLFNPKGARLSGDITPTYGLVSDARISDFLNRFPQTKIVFFARDPIDRFWSQYCMVANQQRRHDLSDRDPSHLETVERFVRDRNGLRHSALTEIVDRWRRPNTENPFALLFFDDLRADALSFRRRVLSFLGADPDKPSGKLPPGYNRKTKNAKVVMRPEVRERLIELLGNEIRECAQRFGGPASEWPKLYGL
jgi:hypothetical protein